MPHVSVRDLRSDAGALLKVDLFAASRKNADTILVGLQDGDLDRRENDG
jgi:hypothetical protein